MRSDPFRFGTPMSGKTRRNILYQAIKRGLDDTAIKFAAEGMLTKVQAYGFHPTKARIQA